MTAKNPTTAGEDVGAIDPGGTHSTKVKQPDPSRPQNDETPGERQNVRSGDRNQMPDKRTEP